MVKYVLISPRHREYPLIRLRTFFDVVLQPEGVALHPEVPTDDVAVRRAVDEHGAAGVGLLSEVQSSCVCCIPT